MGKIKLWASWLGATSTDRYHGFIQYKKGEFRITSDWEYMMWLISYCGMDGCAILPYAQWRMSFHEQRHITSVNNVMFQPFVFDSANLTYDLSQFNDQYFKILKDMIHIANLYGIQIQFKMFDNCGFVDVVGTGEFKKFNPFFNNKQGVKHFLYAGNFATKYVEKVLTEFAGKNVCYEIANEFDIGVGPVAGVNFAKKIFKIFKRYNIQAKDLSYGARLVKPYGNDILQNHLKASRNIPAIYGENDGKYKIKRPVHGFLNDIDQAMKAPQLPRILSDDGWYQTEGEDHLPIHPERNRPQPDQWGFFIEMTLSRFHTFGQAGWVYEHCPKSRSEDVLRKTLTMMSRKFNSFFEHNPTNWQKYEFEYYKEPTPTPPIPDPEPIPDTEPDPDPDPPKWKFIKINNRFPFVHIDFKGLFQRIF